MLEFLVFSICFVAGLVFGLWVGARFMQWREKRHMRMDLRRWMDKEAMRKWGGYQPKHAGEGKPPNAE